MKEEIFDKLSDEWQKKFATHDYLVARAARWLRNSMHCGVVLSEEVSFCMETPDVIGWQSHKSILIECKTSMGDFYADRRKPFRRMPERGMGEYRYYLCGPGIISPDAIKGGWGLLWALPKQIRTIMPARHHDRIKAAYAERGIMYAAMRKHFRERAIRKSLHKWRMKVREEQGA